MKFERTEVFNFNGALRGMRNPMNSWGKGDSYCKYGETDDYFEEFFIGENDMKLAQKLVLAGGEHRKFMRQITVSVDITAPLYWWKEFDTYKIGTTANSTSTMHKLATTPITMDCFETDDYEPHLEVDYDYFDNESMNLMSLTEDLHNEMANHIAFLDGLRVKYLETKNKRYWKELIRWLPESWLQTRTITMNYENLRNMCFQRRNHKLTEWSASFTNWIDTLPYAEELIKYEKET